MGPLTVHPQAAFPLTARGSSASYLELALVITAGYLAISINTEQSFSKHQACKGMKEGSQQEQAAWPCEGAADSWIVSSTGLRREQ